MQKYPVVIDSVKYTRQPKNSDMRDSFHRMKGEGWRSWHKTSEEVLRLAAEGRNLVLSELNEDRSFSSTGFVSVDIDDDDRITDPIGVGKQIGATGIWYTFSHGIKGNRYRLLFELDQRLHDESQVSKVINYLIHELSKRGVPVDVGAKSPTNTVRGGRGCEYWGGILQVQPILKQELKKEQKPEKKKSYSIVPFDELKRMTESVGHIPDGQGRRAEWSQLTSLFRTLVNEESITHEQGLELFHIISGGESPDSTFEKWKSRGAVGIGSLVRASELQGYKSPKGSIQEIVYDFESIKVDRFIPVDLAKSLLSEKQTVLIDSPTGSGKTTSFMNAFNQLASEQDHFYIFACPTIALTDQVSNSHSIMGIKGEQKDLGKKIYSYVKQGGRAFVTTYDMTPLLVDFLTKKPFKGTFSLVVDEIHKYVSDYAKGYRYKAINNLHEASKKARNFIGLSGTTNEVDKDMFDRLIRIDNGNKGIPAQNYVVYWCERNKRDDWLNELFLTIKAVTKERKALVFINSMEVIEVLKKALTKQGIKAKAITSATKKNPEFKLLVDEERITDDVNVVLATNVIADGVNIKNSLEWETLIVCNGTSSIFQPSLIRQMANRLRNPYRRISLFLHKPKNEQRHNLYPFESYFQHSLKIANFIKSELEANEHFNAALLARGSVQNHYGIETINDSELRIDNLYIRHSKYQDQNTFYSSQKEAFVRAVERELHEPKLSGEINVSEEIQNRNLEGAIHREEEEDEQDIQVAFTPSVYEAFQEEKADELIKFQKKVQLRHYACLHRLHKYADYQTCKKVVSKVERDADTHSFFNDVQSTAFIIYQQSILRPDPTYRVVRELLTFEEAMTKKEWNEIYFKVSRKLKMEQKAVVGCLRYLQIESVRDMKARRSQIVGVITPDYLLQKYNLEPSKLAPIIFKISPTVVNTKAKKTVLISIENALQNSRFLDQQNTLV
ncbi:DEAD/DEAH box helicase family protein [Thermoactinomyces sp. DSM 45892]|uniref:DEAD/DEAH box helicase family protein n=1 Tax=Thermoactinomyces sp. DSM 45892 TaxID=1882753 RepID=UPI00089C8C26|nr:DEAD/DEAH box helicase family protein [Thermoactinomyces sp. DSM 45892]SDY68890.1 Helicase conserved C-terminal domain-containing protein [Thermoactinomyces sp. DSM 45892]